MVSMEEYKLTLQEGSKLSAHTSHPSLRKKHRESSATVTNTKRQKKLRRKGQWSNKDSTDRTKSNDTCQHEISEELVN